MREASRYLSMAITFAGIFFNYKAAFYIMAMHKSLKGEYQTIWEGPTGDVWKVDTISVKAIGELSSIYFLANMQACFIGFFGLAKPFPLLVRFYRNYSIVDCVSLMLGTVFWGFAVSRRDVRARFCQELSRHPELLHELSETGLTPQVCELWFGGAILGLMGVMFIIILVRIFMLLVLSKSLRLLSAGSLPPIHLPLASAPPPYTSFSFNHFDASTFTRSNNHCHDTAPVDELTKRDESSLRLCEVTVGGEDKPLVVLDHVGDADVVMPANHVEMIEADVAASAASADNRASRPSHTRLWQDRSGRLRVEATFLGFSDGKIRMLKTNGVIIEVPPRKLSAEDLEYVETLTTGPVLPRRLGDDDDEDDDEPLESRRRSLLTSGEDTSRCD